MTAANRARRNPFTGRWAQAEDSTSKVGATTYGERIRATVETEATALGLTVSVGVASLPEDATTADGLVGAADAALYEAKALGRNRLVGAHPAPRA